MLGGGTNSLVLDDYFPGAVIVFSKMTSIRVEKNNQLVCGAGANNTVIAQTACKSSLSGISWMNRLPGQIGATVRMNARCYGGEISQVVTAVKAVLPDGTIQTFTPADGIFKGYKDTLFMDNGAIVAEATWPRLLSRMSAPVSESSATSEPWIAPFLICLEPTLFFFRWPAA